VQLDQPAREHPGGPDGPALGDRAARQGDDDRLGLAVEPGRAAGAGPLGQGGLQPLGGEPPADVGGGVRGDAEVVGDVGVGLAGVGPQQDLHPVPLPQRQGAGEPGLQLRTLAARQVDQVLLPHAPPPLCGVRVGIIPKNSCGEALVVW